MAASVASLRAATRTHQSPLTLLAGRITRHTAIYALGTLAVGPFSIVSVIFLTRLLAPGQYGDLAVLLVFAGFLTTIYNIGTLHGTFLWVYGASEGGEGDDVEVDAKLTTAPRRALGTGVALTLIVVTLGTLLCFALAPTLAHLQLHRPGGAGALRWAAVSGATGSLWRLTVNVFRMERRPLSFAALNCLRPLFVVGGAVPFVAAGLGVNGALAGTALGTVIATLICIVVARRSYALAFSWPDAKQILLRGSRVVIPVVCLYVVHNADIDLLGFFAPAHELGVYRVASRFAAVPSYFASAFLMAWSPLERGVLFQATYKLLGAERTRSGLLTYYLVVGMTIVLLLDVTAGGLVLFAGSAYRGAAPVIPVLGISFVAYGLFIVIVRAVPAKRRMLWYTIGALIAALLDIGASVVVIPWLGAYGAPVAELIGLGMACALWVGLVTRIEHVSFPFEWRRLAGLAAAVLTAAAVQLGGDALWPAGRPVVLLAVVISYASLIVLLGVIPRAHMRPLVRFARVALRERISAEDPLRGLADLGVEQRALLARLLLDGCTPVTVAERRGTSASAVLGELVAALRVLTRSGEPQPELDVSVGAYLLSKEPEAQRDLVARELLEQGVDALDLLHMDEAAQRLRALPRAKWGQLGELRASDGRGELARLGELLDGLPAATRRAAVAILRDGRTPTEVAVRLEQPAELLAARVVRVLRELGGVGRGSPRDASLGMALFEGAQPDSLEPLDSLEGRALAEVHERIRRISPRRWRRLGARERPLPPSVGARTPEARVGALSTIGAVETGVAR